MVGTYIEITDDEPIVVSQTLAETLAEGNVTGGHNLIQTSSDYFDASDGYTRVNQHLQVGGKIKEALQSSLATAQVGYGKLAFLSASGDGYQPERLALLVNDGYGAKTILTCTDGYFFSKTTTNATPLQAISLALSDNSTYVINYIIVAKQGTSNTLTRAGTVAFYRFNGGSATIANGMADSAYIRSNTSWLTDIAASGNNVVVNLTGVAATNINWAVELSVTKMAMP